MPQLDALTYFSQYIYLLIAFLAVYYYVLSFIIPTVLCTFKIRQKLNSLNRDGLTDSGESTEGTEIQTDSLKLLKVFSKYYPLTTAPGSFESGSSNMALQYDHLLYKSWLTKTSQVNVVESTSQWLVSTTFLQFAQNIRLKKMLCDQIVRKIGISSSTL